MQVNACNKDMIQQYSFLKSIILALMKPWLSPLQGMKWKERMQISLTTLAIAILALWSIFEALSISPSVFSTWPWACSARFSVCFTVFWMFLSRPSWLESVLLISCRRSINPWSTSGMNKGTKNHTKKWANTSLLSHVFITNWFYEMREWTPLVSNRKVT